MKKLSRKTIGLIITGYAYGAGAGQAGPRQMGIYSDALIDGLKN